MKTHLLILTLLCTACNVVVTDANESGTAPSGQKAEGAQDTAARTAGDPYAFTIVPEPAGSQPPQNAILQAQVALDRAGFSPGVLDGKEGMSFTAALTGFQQAKGLPETGKFDEATAKALLGDRPPPATWLVTIPEDFARGPYSTIPKDYGEQAKLPMLGYRNLIEKLAERFHTKPEVLVALNSPDTKLGAGATVRVPAVGNQPVATIEGDERGWGSTLASLAVAKDQPQADHIVVDKSDGVLRVFDAQNALIAQFPRPWDRSMIPCPSAHGRSRGSAAIRISIIIPTCSGMPMRTMRRRC